MFTQILCIDDDPIALMLSKKVIAKAAFSEEVSTVHNGEEALHFFNALKYGTSENINRPQLIFLDLNMPVMGGWEFLDHFTTEEYEGFNSIYVVILSSTINPEDLAKAKEYKIVTDFISKPITQSMLESLKEKFNV